MSVVLLTRACYSLHMGLLGDTAVALCFWLRADHTAWRFSVGRIRRQKPAHPRTQQEAAHWLVRRLIPRNTYPKACEKCDQETKVNAHHFDYSRPLSVVFLCVACHIRIDRMMKAIGFSPSRNLPLAQLAPDMRDMKKRVTSSDAFAQYMKRHRRMTHDDSIGY